MNSAGTSRETHGRMRNAYKISVLSMRKWGNNNKVDTREVNYENVDFIQLIPGRYNALDSVNMVMNLRFPQ
jgi:hypothetical protein